MSDPFRSQVEQLLEQLRRAEEKTNEAIEQRRELETALALRRRPWGWVAGIAGGAMVAAALGYSGASLDATRTLARDRADRERAALDAVERERSALALCTERRDAVEQQLAACESRCSVISAWGTARTDTCRCEPGDPLCACIGKTFDRGAAAAALGGAQPMVARCFDPKRTLSLHATVTFEQAGHVSTVTVDGGSLSEQESSCVVGALRRVRVPAFDGQPVRVGKSYAVAPAP